MAPKVVLGIAVCNAATMNVMTFVMTYTPTWIRFVLPMF